VAEVTCPSVVLSTITPTAYLYQIPNAAAGSATTVKAGTVYMNTVAATCARTYRLLEKPSIAVISSWLTITAAGDVQVDTNVKGTKDLVVEVTSDGNVQTSTQFTVTVSCQALTALVLSPVTYSYVVPNTAAAAVTKIITGSTAYITNPSTNV
jgi:hypothetical protein